MSTLDSIDKKLLIKKKLIGKKNDLTRITIDISFDLREILKNGNMVYIAEIEKEGTNYFLLPELYESLDFYEKSNEAKIIEMNDENKNIADKDDDSKIECTSTMQKRKELKENDGNENIADKVADRKIESAFIMQKRKELENYVNKYTQLQKNNFSKFYTKYINTIGNPLKNESYCKNLSPLVRNIEEQSTSTYFGYENVIACLKLLQQVSFKSSLVKSNITNNKKQKLLFCSHSLNRPKTIDDEYRLGMCLEDMMFSGTDLGIWYHIEKGNDKPKIAFVFFYDVRNVDYFEYASEIIHLVFHKHLDGKSFF